MPQIDEMIDALIAREGGYVNDPDDPGGATKYGITIHTLSSTRGHKCSPSDVRALTMAQAKEIYKRKYLIQPCIDHLPEALVPSVFDMYVNAGNRAVKLLQETLNKFGASLVVDGSIGPNTVQVAQMIDQLAGRYLVDAYGIERRNFYYRLADKRVASRKYAKTRKGGKGGWIKRAEEFISEPFWLTNEEHQERTAGW